MTAENVAAFPQPKPTIADIVHTCVMAGRSARDILTMSREAHPAKPFDAIKAEIVGAFQTRVEKEVGAEKLDAIGDAVARELDRVETEAPSEPLYVPVAHVVDRIVNETLDAIGPSEPGEARRLKTWTDVAVAIINRHPSHTNLVSWLAMQGLEDALCSAASERDLDLDYVMDFGSPEIEATEADEKHSQVMQAEFEEVRRRIAKRS
jgi:hypothetical protein